MIKVLKAGFYTTVQDMGRIGFASFGVPVSGVMDSYSANIANSILDNSIDSALLEITFGGTKIQFLADTFIAISGADFSPVLNQQKINHNTRIKINSGDVLSFGKLNFGVRSYLAVKGGIQTPKVLNSRSQYQSITKNFRLQKGDILKIVPCVDDTKSTNATVKLNLPHFTSTDVECFEGPEFYLLSLQQKKQLLKTMFRVSSENSRMGYHLKETIRNNFPSILTSGVVPGTVQLTPSGKLIVLMRDCQVTGGYPRILQLTEKAINKMAQKTLNAQFKFRLINA
ncbi:biotin-dependent carboxyltransferase family protein [uncultured Polaribacter sp.]|uniref:5-oxoprolinase subunit C family protein n=1 Tax=uncultured Polaribacter sp. TaxID=174711 RepID=UPI00259B4D08|nr:biotin-dependent carboxyltransferase family protein [uncultured Polaribacter sp.]